MHQHIIVSGDDALASTIIGELKSAGASVVRLASSEVTGVARELGRAEVSKAQAVICAGDDDAANLEIALLARRANPAVRVVARISNDVLRMAVAADNGPGAILDVAELTASAVVEACLAQPTHPFEAAGIQFVVAGSEAPREATLREIFGELTPVAVIHGDDSPTPGEMDVCPSREQQVHAGDRAVLIGTAEESSQHGIRTRRPRGTRSRRARLRRIFDADTHRRQRLQPGVLSGVGGCHDADHHLHAAAALQLPTPADVMGRRVVLHHRDDHDDGIRRLQLRPPADVAASVRRRFDVRRRNDHRSAGRVHRRRTAVASLRLRRRAATGTPPPQPRDRRRIERARDAGGHRAGGDRL